MQDKAYMHGKARQGPKAMQGLKVRPKVKAKYRGHRLSNTQRQGKAWQRPKGRYAKARPNGKANSKGKAWPNGNALMLDTKTMKGPKANKSQWQGPKKR
jgi:hypothetical protein